MINKITNNRIIAPLVIMVSILSIISSCKNDTDLKTLYQNCYLFKDARVSLKIRKDTTLTFPIQSLSSSGDRTTTFSLDPATIGKENLNFIIPDSYTFKPGETKGEVAIVLKYIDSDSLVRVVMNLKTDNCIGYVEDTIQTQNYKTIRIEYQSIQSSKKGNF